MDLCTPELKQKLTPIRERIKEMDDKKAAALKVGGLSFMIYWLWCINQGAKQPAKPATAAAKEIKYEPYDFPDGECGCGQYCCIYQPHPQTEVATTVDTTI